MVVSLYEFKVHKRIFTHFYHDGMRDLLEEDLVKTFPPGNSFIPENIFVATFSRIDSSLVLVWSFDRKNFPKDWCVGVLRKRLCHQKGMLPSLLWRLQPSGKEAKHREGVYKAFWDVLRLDVAHLEEACVDVLMLWWLRWCLQKLRRGGSQKRHSSQHLNERKISSDCGWLSKTNK